MARKQRQKQNPISDEMEARINSASESELQTIMAEAGHQYESAKEHTETDPDICAAKLKVKELTATDREDMKAGWIMTPDQEYKRGVRAAVGIAVLCALCVLASLSGLRSSSAQHSELSSCLTAAKFHRWESALLGWARKGDAQCVESAKAASKYLVNANRTLAGATSALDLAADGEAKKLMQDAAVKCGEVVP